MKMEKSFRNARLMHQRFQPETKNGKRLWLGSLEIRELIANLFATTVDLQLTGMRSRVLQLADDQADAFLADRVTGREVKNEEQQIRNPSQCKPR